MSNPFLAYLCREHRAEAVLPEPNRFMANVDAALVQKVLDIPERKRKPDIHHHRQADDLGARLEVAKGAVFCHPATLIARPTLLNRFCTDSAHYKTRPRSSTSRNPPKDNCRR